MPGTFTNDGVAVTCVPKVTVELSAGVWTDITARVLQSGSVAWGGGIRGTRRTDVMASSTPLRWVFKNETGEYYPDGPSPLAGWKKGVRVRIYIVFNGVEYIQYIGRVTSVEYDVNIFQNSDTVKVTVGDWLYQAQQNQILTPETETDLRADQAVQSLLANYVTVQPLAVNLDEGDTIFETVFDTVREKTTAYSELSKIANSESAPIYLERDRVYGETLRVENRTRRDTAGVVSKLPKDGVLILEDGSYLVTEDDEAFAIIDEWTPETLDSGYVALRIEDGANQSNKVTFITKPRRTDDNLVQVGSTGDAIPVAAGQTVDFKINYIDPDGGGTRVSVLTNTIQTPRPGTTQNTNIKSLLHFNGNFDDETGLRSWTTHDTELKEDVYSDGYGTQRLSGSVIGGYAIFGGYADYFMTTPDSADFDFEGGDFTIGCWVAPMDVSLGGNVKAVLARNNNLFPPWLFGLFDYPTGELRLYASTNGTSNDYADGKKMGKASASKWSWLEWGRASGWNYISQNGEIVEKWYNASAFPAGAGALHVGLTRVGQYMFVAVDELYINKGECLHTGNFTPPQTEFSIYHDEDYWGDTKKDRSGTDITSDITIALTTIGTDSTSGTITNGGAVDGFVFLRLRGRGVYRYQDLPYTAEDSADIAVNGYVNPISVTQPYQVDTTAAKIVADSMITNEGASTTDLMSITIIGNKSEYWMLMSILFDVGDVVPIEFARAGISGNYYIQAVDKVVKEGNVLYTTWLLRKDFGV